MEKLTKINAPEILEKALEEYNDFATQDLNLDLSRGKPHKSQLDLSSEMLNIINSKSTPDSESGIDCRNYGGADGIPEARRLLADMIGTHSDNIIVGGNSSLNLMFDVVSHAMTHGVCGSEPWIFNKHRKFLCPVPGYDRHFAITGHFGFEMIPVKMDENGPDMEQVERLVSQDQNIKGIWCVPKYQNPTGIVFSDEVISRFAALKPAAGDFRIFWDNAYAIHGFYPDDDEPIPDILSLCEKNGNADMVYEFCSTSKVTFPGSSIAGVASSPANLIDLRNFMKYQTIGPDKLNQLRHVRFFKNSAGLRAHMAKHAELLLPKFQIVNNILMSELEGLEIASWFMPKGGYFISYNTLDGCASNIIKMCKDAGVTFTPAGSTWPGGYDPHDSNIRLAPSYAENDEIEKAVKLLSVCTKIVSARKMLSEQ